MSDFITASILDQLADAIVTRLVNSFNIQPAQQAPQPEAENTDKLLTRREVLKLLSISPPTLSAWQKKGSLKAYRINRRVFFRKSDIHTALKPVKTA